MLTPDGVRYYAAAQQRVARPFHLRWLLPRLCGQNPRRWTITTQCAIVALGALSAAYAGSVWMACVAFLPGIAFSWRRPVLVDATGMALALAAALMLPIFWPAAVLLALIAGCVRETSPIWASVYAWNPVLLIGLLPVAVRWLMRQGDDVLDAENAWVLQHPIKASRKYHAGLWADPFTMVTPWGAMVVGLAGLDAQLAAALALGYSQLIVATDSVRLYQWAAPVLALACVHVLPPWALPFVALGVVFNPWKGSGL